MLKPNDATIASPIQVLLDLFATDLAEVKFPALDRAVLTETAAQVQIAAAELQQAEAALEVARSALSEHQELLLQRALRALAYARVFAEDRPELSSKLEAISLPRSTRRSRSDSPSETPLGSGEPSAPRRRGRPKSEEGVSLFTGSVRSTGSHGEGVSNELTATPGASST
jgi:hypothetical protein